MARDIYGLIAREYGIDSANVVDGEVANAGAGPIRFFRQNPRRVAFTFQNLSANALGILNASNIVAASRQITIPAGGIATLNWKEDLIFPAMEWWVLGTAAAEAFLALGIEIDAAVEGQD